MNFIYLRKFSTLSVIKLVFDNDIIEDTSYGLTSMTSSFSTLLVFSFSSSLYSSWISQILLSTYLLSFPLYQSSSLANILWIWNICSSMLLWTRYRRFSDIWVILVVFITQLLILTIKIDPSISVIIVLASSTSFLMSFTNPYMSIIVSNPFSILWYSLDQSSLSFFMIYTWSILFNFLKTYGFGDVGTMVKVLLFVIWEDILFVGLL